MKNLLAKTLNIVKQNPIELFTILSFIGGVISLRSMANIIPTSYFIYTSLLVIYAINTLSLSRIFYYLSAGISVAAIWLAFWCEHTFSPNAMAITSLCALLALMIAKGSGDNRNFVIQGCNILKNLTFAALTSGVIAALILILTLSLDSVFETRLFKACLPWILIMCIYIIAPFAFLYFDRRSRDISFEGKGNFYSVLINYILSPATLIYGVVLYMYFAKVIIAWTLPNGGIAQTSILFIAIGLITSGCRKALQKPILEPAFRNFTLLAAPAVIMMWISAWVRIAEYGMTANRGYLVTLLLVATMWCVAMLREKLCNFRALTIASISIMIAYNIVAFFAF